MDVSSREVAFASAFTAEAMMLARRIQNEQGGHKISKDDQVKILTKEIATSRYFADKMTIEIERLSHKNDEISKGQKQNLETTKIERLKLVEHNIKCLKDLLSQDDEMINNDPIFSLLYHDGTSFLKNSQAVVPPPTSRISPARNMRLRPFMDPNGQVVSS